MWQAMAVGTAISLYGSLKAASAERKAAAAQAAAKRLQATQILERFEINRKEREREREKLLGDLGGQYVKGGVSGTSTSALLLATETYMAIDREIGYAKKEAEDQATILRMGGDIAIQSGRDASAATQIGAAGTFLRNASSAYSEYSAGKKGG